MLISWSSELIIISVLIAMLGSFTALTHAARMRDSSGHQAVIWMVAGGVTLGMAIWAMHFIGMLAFHLPVPITYDGSLTFISVLPAIAAALLAFYLLRSPQLQVKKIVIGGCFMGLGIAAMHYTGMAALKMQPAISYNPTIFMLSVVIAIVAACGAVLVVYGGERTRLHPLLQHLVGAVIMGVAIAGMHYTAMAGAIFAPGSICLSSGVRIEPNLLALMVMSGCFLLFGGGGFASLLDRHRALDKVQLAHIELRAAQEKILHLAFHDPLTQLPNRRLLQDRLQQAIIGSVRNRHHGAIMFIDLDHFKHLNDSWGHNFGDMLLVEVARRLQASVREGDTVSRLGGDEFVILLEALSADAKLATVEAQAIAEKISAMLNQPYLLQTDEYHITSSIGISLFCGDVVADDLLKQADTAMYQAKSAGRNTLRFFNPATKKH